MVMGINRLIYASVAYQQLRNYINKPLKPEVEKHNDTRISNIGAINMYSILLVGFCLFQVEESLSLAFAPGVVHDIRKYKYRNLILKSTGSVFSGPWLLCYCKLNNIDISFEIRYDSW